MSGHGELKQFVHPAHSCTYEGRQFQLQSGQGRHTPASPAFADTHASSTARRNSLSSVTWLGESAAIGHSPRGVFFDGTVLPSRTSRNRLPADCRYGGRRPPHHKAGGGYPAAPNPPNN